MGFAWKGLFGLGIFNIFIIAIEIMKFKTEDGTLSTSHMLIMSGINWIITIVTLLTLMRIYGHKKLERPIPVPSPLANMGVEAD